MIAALLGAILFGGVTGQIAYSAATGGAPHGSPAFCAAFAGCCFAVTLVLAVVAGVLMAAEENQ